MLVDIDDLKDKYVEEIISKTEEELNKCREDLKYVVKPEDLESFSRYYKALELIAEDIKQIHVEMSMESIRSYIDEVYEKNIFEYNNSIVAINDKYDALVEQKVSELEKISAEHNEQVMKQHEIDNEIYIKLEEKRKVLEVYSDKIIDMCTSYGITSSDLSVDNSTFGLDELNELYDKYIDFMNKESSNKNAIAFLRAKVPNTLAQGGIILALLLLAFTPVLDFISLAFIFLIVYNQLHAEEVMKKYTVLMGIVFNVNPLELGFKEDVEKELLESETIDVDENQIIQQYADAWEEELQKAREGNPEDEYASIKLQLINNAQEYDSEFLEIIKGFEYEKEEMIQDILKEIERAKEEFEDLKSKVKLLGDEISLDYWIDTRFRLGLKDGVIEEYQDIGLQNLIIAPTEDTRRTNEFVQILYANIVCNSRPGQLYTEVYDPNKMGQALINFYNSKLDTYLQFKTEKLKDIIQDLQKEAAATLKIIGNKTIQEYNKESQEMNRSPRSYRLLIVMSQPKEILEDEAIRDFMTYSATYGVFIWVIADTHIENVRRYNIPFEGIRNPYEFDVTKLGSKVLANFQETLDTHTAPFLSWKEYTDVLFPKGEIWTQNADKFVKMYPGFVNGDPTDCPYFTVGNTGNVHGFIGGVTGAGKSGIINAMIASLCLNNSPNDLELWLIDLKGNEFTFYLPSEEHPYYLPHISMCLCTSDPDYCGSVYAAIEDRMKKRFKFLTDQGCKDLLQYNTKCRNEGRPEDVLPRVLIINDEWQALFVNASNETQPIIKKAIIEVTKKGRAAGIHFLPASQELQNTVPENILANFTLRYALRCDDATSKSLLGNGLSAKIKETIGYCYVKSSEMLSEKEMPKIRIPYINNDELRGVIKQTYDEAIKRGCKKKTLIAYSEDDVFTTDDLKKYYEDVIIPADPKSWPIILGERMTYSVDNLAPDNIALPRKNNMHIASVFANEEDIVNFYKTIITNLKYHPGEKDIFINSQVEELHYLCEVDLDLQPAYMPLSKETYSIYKLLALFESLYEKRKESGEKEKPMYIILIGWDKAIGFGIEKDSSLIQNYVKLLQLCGEFNMHFIFIFSSCATITGSLLSACKINIAGRCDEGSSSFMLGKPIAYKVEKPEKGFMYRKIGNSYVRSKLYQYPITREIVPDEFIVPTG